MDADTFGVMESAPEDRPPLKIELGRRFNELASDGSLFVYCLFSLVLLAPLAATFFIRPPSDLIGWAALAVYGWFAVSVFKGFVLGRWR